MELLECADWFSMRAAAAGNEVWRWLEPFVLTIATFACSAGRNCSEILVDKENR